MPYLLELLEIPTDMYQLFLVTGVVVGRFGAMLAALHIICIGLLGTLALMGKLRFDLRALMIYLLGTVGLVALLVVLLRGFFLEYRPEPPDRQEMMTKATQMVERVPARVLTQSTAQADSIAGQSSFERIRREGVLRIGFRPANLPCTFLTADKRLVGFDIEMVHMLAQDLGVELEFLPFEIVIRYRSKPGAPAVAGAAKQMALSEAAVASLRATLRSRRAKA